MTNQNISGLAGPDGGPIGLYKSILGPGGRSVHSYKTSINNPNFYPGERPECHFITVYDENGNTEVREIYESSGGLKDLGNWEIEGLDKTINQYLTENGEDSIENRTPIASHGSNACPSTIDKKFSSKHAITDYGNISKIVINVSGETTGIPTIATRLSKYSALSAAFEEDKNYTTGVFISYFNNDQVRCMNDTEGIKNGTYFLASKEIQVGKELTTALMYFGGLGSFTTDSLHLFDPKTQEHYEKGRRLALANTNWTGIEGNLISGTDFYPTPNNHPTQISEKEILGIVYNFFEAQGIPPFTRNDNGSVTPDEVNRNLVNDTLKSYGVKTEFRGSKFEHEAASEIENLPKFGSIDIVKIQ